MSPLNRKLAPPAFQGFARMYILEISLTSPNPETNQLTSLHPLPHTSDEANIRPTQKNQHQNRAELSLIHAQRPQGSISAIDTTPIKFFFPLQDTNTGAQFRLCCSGLPMSVQRTRRKHTPPQRGGYEGNVRDKGLALRSSSSKPVSKLLTRLSHPQSHPQEG